MIANNATEGRKQGRVRVQEAWTLHPRRGSSGKLRCLAILILGFFAMGCATSSPRQDRIRDAASWPSGARLKESCLTALRSPGTWAPAAAAALMTVDDWDGKISRWAVEETPIFGSPERARETSDDLRGATHLAMIATALAAAGEEHTWGWRFQRLAVEQTASMVNIETTNMLKGATGRQRPDGSDEASFPSGHSSKAFNYAAFASRNLETSTLGDAARRGFRIGFYTLAAGTAWARVEGEKHYPSDVLAGAALGHFMGLLFYDAFLRGHEGAAVDVQLSRDGASLAVRLRF